MATTVGATRARRAAARATWAPARRRSKGAVTAAGQVDQGRHRQRGGGGGHRALPGHGRRPPRRRPRAPTHTSASVRSRRVHASGEVRPRSDSPTGPTATTAAVAKAHAGQRDESRKPGHGDDEPDQVERRTRSTTAGRSGSRRRRGSARAGPPAATAARPTRDGQRAHAGHGDGPRAITVDAPAPARPRRAARAGAVSGRSGRRPGTGSRWASGMRRRQRPGHRSGDLGVVVAPHQLDRAAQARQRRRRSARSPGGRARRA